MNFFLLESKNCNSCNICYKKCPVSAIIKDNVYKYILLYNRCFFCGICFFACPLNVIINKNKSFIFNLNIYLINKRAYIKRYHKKKSYIFLNKYYYMCHLDKLNIYN